MSFKEIEVVFEICQSEGKTFYQTRERGPFMEFISLTLSEEPNLIMKDGILIPVRKWDTNTPIFFKPNDYRTISGKLNGYRTKIKQYSKLITL